MINRRLHPISENYFKEHIHPYILGFKNRRGRPTSIRDYDFCAVLFVMRTGIAWRDLPDHYGAWHTIYTRFKRWSESGWFWTSSKETNKRRLYVDR